MEFYTPRGKVNEREAIEYVFYGHEEMVPRFYIKNNFGQVNLVFEPGFNDLFETNPELYDDIIDKPLVGVLTCEDKSFLFLCSYIVNNLKNLIRRGEIFKSIYGWQTNFVE